MSQIILSLPHSIKALSKSLDGSQGTNRAPLDKCQIQALNDYEAMLCWLNEYRHKKTTYQSYQKEGERFILWCLFQIQKPLSSLNRDDFESYFEFLGNPAPFDQWCNPKRCTRHSKDWRPFVGPLSTSAQMSAMAIIGSLIHYLVTARYLEFNPLMLMRKISKRKPNLIEEKLHLRNRILEPDEWAAMLHTLENLPEDEPHQKDEKERLRAIVCFLYLLGLRVGDLVTHTWQAFQKINGKWWFVAKGKGDKVGTIPVNQELFGIVKRYRSHLGLPEEPLGEALPLILSWRKETPLTARHINRLLKNLAYETSKHLDNPDKKEKLQHFSAHWLRHLSATMQDRAGMRFEHIKANHRHENDQTTRKYIHALDDERHQDMEKLSLKIIV